MELKDNFTNRYFKPDLVKSQMDLINQPTEVDAYADAFNKQANREAKGPAQRNSNALMAGFGAGLKGAANAKRQEELSPILKMVGELNARSAYLEAQMQQDEQQRMTMVKFLRDNAGAIEDLGNASVANSPEAQEIAKHLSNKLEILTGKSPGQFDYYDTQRRRSNYRQPDGSTVGYSVLDSIEQYADEAYGEAAPYMLRNLSPWHSKKYKEAEETRNLAMEKGRADIRNTNSQADYHNAQSTHLGMQDKKIENEINNPPLTPAQAKTKELNEKRFNKRTDEAEGKRVLNNAYEQYIENIEEAKKKGLTGKSKLAEWKRYWAEKTGNSENMDVEEMLRITHANRVKELGGSNANQRQFEVAMASAPSITKDPDATIKFLDKIIEQNNEYLNETDHLGQTWENSNWQGQERSILNDYRSKHQKNNGKSDRNNNDMVQVRSPSGKIGMIPRAALSKAIGYEVVE